MVALGLALPACGGSPAAPVGPPGADTTPNPPADTTSGSFPIPALGDSATLDIGCWNVEWFGSPEFDPADDALQLTRVTATLRALRLDVYGLVEVVAAGPFRALVNSLPGYAGVLASDASVRGGAAAYEGWEQKPALVYRTAAVELDSARVVLADHDEEFAGRPPLEAHLRITVGGVTERLVVLVVHMKAGAGTGDRDRRQVAAAALKAYLDGHFPADRVLVIGDFNDDVDASIAGGASPYAAFIADTTRWRVPTAALSAAGISSTTGYPDMIDHQLWSDEAWAGYVPGSAAVVPLDDWIPDYGATTSDHFPVVARYAPVG